MMTFDRDRLLVSGTTAFAVPPEDIYLGDVKYETRSSFLENRSAGKLVATPMEESPVSPFWRLLEHCRSQNRRLSILDIGGFFGFWGIQVAERCRAMLPAFAETVIFEPTPLADLIQDNIELNQLSENCRVVRAGISDKNGISDYYSASDAFISGRLYEYPNSRVRCTAAALTIDTVLCSMKPRDYVLAKIDTEGFETAVLSGALGSFSRWPFVLVLEFWPWLRNYKVAARTYREFLLETFDVFDIGSSCDPVPRGKNDVAQFDKLADGLQAQGRCTDLICIAKSFGELSEELFRELYRAK